MCPRQGSPFSLLAQRKGTKRKGTLLTGRPRADCSALLGLCSSRRTRYAACGRCAQTAARSQLLMRATRAAAKPCAARRFRRGPRAIRRLLRKHSIHASLRIGVVEGPPWGAMRSELPAVGPRGRRRGAQGFGVARVSALQQLTSGGCSSAVSAANVASSARHPKDRAPQRSPPVGRAASVGSPFFAYFLWRRKESRSAAGPKSRRGLAQ